MTAHRPFELRIERTFEASAEVDLRVGGRVRVIMRSAEDGAGGEYAVIEPPHRLVFSWTFDDDPSNTQLIELEFSEREGVTTVVMFNSAISSERRRDQQMGGWHECFDNLERALATPSS